MGWTRVALFGNASNILFGHVWALHGYGDIIWIECQFHAPRAMRCTCIGGKRHDTDNNFWQNEQRSSEIGCCCHRWPQPLLHALLALLLAVGLLWLPASPCCGSRLL